MDTFVLFLVTATAWFALEFARVLQKRGTISGQVWKLRVDSPTLGHLLSLITGALWAHFFWGQCGPL